MRYRTGDIEFDEETATVYGPHGAVPLRKQVAQTLSVLITRAPALVSVDELLDAVWGRHEISPSAVPQAIRELRRTLGDQAQEPIYIETRHRQGYRWLPSVHTVASAAAANAGSAPTTPEAAPSAPRAVATSHGLRRWVVPLLLLAVVVQALVFWLWRQSWMPQADAFAVTTDPAWRAAQQAFVEFRLSDSARALDALPQDEVATHLLRARIAMLRADAAGIDAALAAARDRLSSTDRPGTLWLDAVQAQAEGKETQAWSHLEPLLALRPQDLDLKLLAWELRRKIPDERMRALMGELETATGLPASRRALLAAQFAGVRRDGAMQREHAQRVMDEFGDANPAMAAFARAELALAAENLRDSDTACTLAVQAGEALERVGLIRPAVRSMKDAVWNARAQDKLNLAEQHLAHMQRLLDGHHDPIGVISMRHLRALLFGARGDNAAAVDALTQLAADYEAIGDFGGAANALNSTVQPRYQLGRNEEVPAVIERALQLATRAQAHATVGFLHGSLGNHYVRSGDLQRGHDQLVRALDSFRAAGERRAEATALGNLSEVAAMRGRMDEAAQYNEQAVVLERAQNSPGGVAYAQSRLARVYAARGDLARALEVAEQAAAGFAQVGERKEEALTRGTLGQMRLGSADLAAARALLTQIEGLRDAGPLVQAEENGLAGAIAFYQGDFAAARARFESEAQTWLGAQEMIEVRQAEIDALRARLALKESVAVEEEARELLKRAEIVQSHALARQTQLVLAQALVAQGRRGEAESALSEVEAILTLAPDPEAALRVVLLRASLDRDPNTRRERLSWAVAQAEAKGLRLFALEARGELAHDRGGEALRTWRAEVANAQATGLTRRVPVVAR